MSSSIRIIEPWGIGARVFAYENELRCRHTLSGASQSGSTTNWRNPSVFGVRYDTGNIDFADTYYVTRAGRFGIRTSSPASLIDIRRDGVSNLKVNISEHDHDQSDAFVGIHVSNGSGRQGDLVFQNSHGGAIHLCSSTTRSPALSVSENGKVYFATPPVSLGGEWDASVLGTLSASAFRISDSGASRTFSEYFVDRATGMFLMETSGVCTGSLTNTTASGFSNLAISMPSQTGVGIHGDALAMYGNRAASSTIFAVQSYTASTNVAVNRFVVSKDHRVGIPTISSTTTTTLNVASGNANATQFIDRELGQTSVIVPLGTVLMFAGATIPTGYMLCDGASLSRTEYPALFAVLGTTFGAPSGTTFRIPDMRGRSPIGSHVNRSSSYPSGISSRTTASTGGSQNVTLTTAQIPVHTHSATVQSTGGHSHTATCGNQTAGWNPHWHPIRTGLHHRTYRTTRDPDRILQREGHHHRHKVINNGESNHTHVWGATVHAAHSHAITNQNRGSGQSHTNMHPVTVVRYIIRTG